MKIAFVHFPGRLSRLEAARAGTAPTEFLFLADDFFRKRGRNDAEPDLVGNQNDRRGGTCRAFIAAIRRSCVTPPGHSSRGFRSTKYSRLFSSSEPAANAPISTAAVSRRVSCSASAPSYVTSRRLSGPSQRPIASRPSWAASGR